MTAESPTSKPADATDCAAPVPSSSAPVSPPAARSSSVLSKSLAMVRLILSTMSSRSRSMRACRSDLDDAPLTASRSLFLPSMASLSTYEAPTLKRMRGIPALTKRWPPGGGLLGGGAAAAAEAGRFVPAVNARELIMRCHEPTCGCR
eukprot:CAMPEP_0185806020 /NCGR_PEP_ID=MMETSP1322-20130828/4198_1 /TAXON_ID=265543 /ORGANISM="Minutocellus polymorphus, Strain RCC2270" /LENGTH=147 /DNA_ID=CAMNT_0028502089 /DNA_START=103 /DNA_END=541 /DNA_ORIENTATION=-